MLLVHAVNIKVPRENIEKRRDELLSNVIRYTRIIETIIDGYVSRNWGDFLKPRFQRLQFINQIRNDVYYKIDIYIKQSVNRLGWGLNAQKGTNTDDMERSDWNPRLNMVVTNEDVYCKRSRSNYCRNIAKLYVRVFAHSEW